MAKTKISEFSATPANNTDIDGINIAEGCAPSGINDAIRELMAQLKDWQSGTSNDPYVIGSSGSLTLNQGTANGVPYLNGSKVVTSGSALTFDGTNFATTGSVTSAGASNSGNLAFTGTGNRITGDFTNATIASRVIFQSSTTNGASGVISIPNGTGVIASWSAQNSSDVANGANIAIRASDTDMSVRSGITGTGTYLPMTFYTGGSERMRVDTSGNLGIGTSSPSFKLDVTGTLRSTGEGRFDNGINLKTATLNYVYFDDAVSFTRNGTGERMRIDTSGNLGLGVTPSAWGSTYRAIQLPSSTYGGGSFLTDAGSPAIAANAYNNSGWKYVNNDYATIYQSRSGQHQWFTAASGTAGNAISFTQAMTLDVSGNLLVGTTSTSSNFNRYLTLHNSSVDSVAVRFTNSATGQTSSDGFEVGSIGVDSYAYNRENGGLIFGTNNAERARIDSSGKLLVNTSSALLAGNLQVNATGTDGAITSKSSEWSTYTQYIWNATTTDNSRFVSFGTQGTYTERGSIDYNRGSNVTRFITTSDATLKNIIGDHNGQRSREILNTTRIREFAWKADSDQKPQIGVIAQELHETFKGAVSVGGENAQGDYTPWGVDKTAFTFHLIAGWQAHEKIIQEQQAIILAQQTALTALTARVEALESN